MRSRVVEAEVDVWFLKDKTDQMQHFHDVKQIQGICQAKEVAYSWKIWEQPGNFWEQQIVEKVWKCY